MSAIRWRIELFGSLRLLRGDQVVASFPPSKVGSLFACLACPVGRKHTRQELAELFWPEVDNSTGRTRLRQHLASLRHQLEPDDVSPGTILHADREEMFLERSSFETDVEEFERALRQSDEASNSDDRITRLRQAVSLYRGEFMSGYFDYWIVGERERLKERMKSALWALACAREEANDIPRAIEHLRRLTAVDPLCDESHHALIRLLIAARQPAAARRQYRTLEHILKTELGEAPAIETQALVEDIADGREASGANSFEPDVIARIALEDGHSSAELSPRDVEEPPTLLQTPLPEKATALVLAPGTRLRARGFRLRLSLACVVALAGIVLFAVVWYRSWRRYPAGESDPHWNYSPAAKGAGRQDELWIDRYVPGPGDKDSQATAVTVDKDGYIYVAGFIDTYKNDVDYITIKYAPDGTRLWESRYNGTGNDVDRAFFIAVDADGSVFVAGESLGKTGSGPGELNEMDLAIVKYDADGRQVAVERYDGPGHGRDYLAGIQLDGKGHLYVLAGTWAGERGNGRDGHVSALIQYDTKPIGDRLKQNWIWLYADPDGGPASGAGIVLDKAASVYIVQSLRYGFVVQKVDSAGHLVWEQVRRTPANERFGVVRFLADAAGDLYIVGQANRKAPASNGDKSAVSVVKYANWGQLLRDQTYWNETQGDICTFACVSGGGCIFVTGENYAAGRAAEFMLRIREDGTVWAQTTYPGGPGERQIGLALALDRRNLIHMVGRGQFASLGQDPPIVNGGEALTVTYDNTLGPLRIRRYAGAQIIRCDRGVTRAIDADCNLVVAGQTWGGTHNDLFIVKYPP